jgi:hypothetical protein
MALVPPLFSNSSLCALEQWKLTLAPWSSPWSLEDHFGWRLIQELLGQGVMELTLEIEGYSLILGAHPKIMKAHTGVL